MSASPAAAGGRREVGDDLALLRAYEPVVRFTRGERFFPADTVGYIRQCGLWAHHPDGYQEELVPDGELTVERLVEPRRLPAGTVLYMRLVGPLNVAESARALSTYRHHDDEEFHAGLGRLARVGYASRLIDAAFSGSLLLRGRVPAAIAAAARQSYLRSQAEEGEHGTGAPDHASEDRPADRYGGGSRDDARASGGSGDDAPTSGRGRAGRHVYYGRVVREGGWIALQYWFFYYYNAWRSGYGGVNDHEADWEQIMVFLYRDPATGAVRPRWVAYATHDLHGDDVRRRWDDAGELERIGTHPVVYAGAGSHAAYFRPGEYQTDVSLPLPARLDRVRRTWDLVWSRVLGQSRLLPAAASPLRIPFVDYARGDGRSVGPGQDHPWEAVLLDPVPPWVVDYRGLWGLFARDPISGENAPAGPAYNRDGTVRAAWYHPLGFAGLDKVAPPPLHEALVHRRRAELSARRGMLDAEIQRATTAAQELGAQVTAMVGEAHLDRRRASDQARLALLQDELKALHRERAENDVLADSLARAESQGEDPRAHIVHLMRPATAEELRFSRLAEIWAAASIGLLVLGAGALAYALPSRTWLGLVALVVAFVLVESVLRATYTRTVTGLAVALSLVSLTLVVFHFWSVLLVVGLVLAGGLLVWDNTRELRG